MPKTTVFGDFYAPSEDVVITCANLNTTLDSMKIMADLVGRSPTQVYFEDHSSATLTILDNDLPTAYPNRIKVIVNGVREYDVALIATGSYTVDNAGQITLSYTPSNAQILVEYELY